MHHTFHRGMALPPGLEFIEAYVSHGESAFTTNPVVAYFCFKCAVEEGMRANRQSPEAVEFLAGMVARLEAMAPPLGDAREIVREAAFAGEPGNVLFDVLGTFPAPAPVPLSLPTPPTPPPPPPAKKFMTHADRQDAVEIIKYARAAIEGGDARRAGELLRRAAELCEECNP